MTLRYLSVLVLAAPLLAAGCSKPAAAPYNAPAASSAKPDAKKTYTRDEFKALVIGKTKDEVLKALGRPYRTNEYTNETLWVYREVTYDPVAGRVDLFAHIGFKEGKAVRLHF